jgi:ATP-dependent DNA ligase
MDAGATQQRIRWFRSQSNCASLNQLLRGVREWPFQRRKPAAIGVKAPFPGFIEPALATLIEKVPSGARWIHEIKFDG